MKRKVTCFTSMALAVLMAVSPVVGSSVSAFAAEPSDDTAAIQVTPSKEDVSDEIVVETDSDAIEVEKEMQASAKIGDTGESAIVVDTEYHMGDAVPVHVTAENPTDKAADFRLYFWDYGESLPEDKAEWFEVLTDACEDVRVAELQDTDEYAVDLMQGKDTVQGKAAFVSDKDDNDQLTAAYLSIELPAETVLDTVFHISSDVAETVTVIPVFGVESENAFYGDASTVQWKEKPIVVEPDETEDTAEAESETEDSDVIVVETEEPADSFLSIYVGDSSAATETEEPVVEEGAETEESDTDTESEVSVEAETEEDDSVTVTPDVADLNASDFASMRLVVLADDASVITNDGDVIGQYGNVYLLQFTSIQQAMNAYVYYKDKVTAVEPDGVVETAAESADTADGEELLLDEESNPFQALSDLPEMKESHKDDCVIALLDTGVKEHENVIDRISVIDDVLEGNGHGDDVLEAIVSQDKDASILSVRMLDNHGKGTVSSLVAAMEYAIEQKVDIINLSLYAKTTLSTSVLEQEILKATEAGIVVVGAAGNDDADVIDYMPGSVEEAYIIGSANEDGSRFETSNYGVTVDYNVVAESTSEAAALFTGYVSEHGLDALNEVLNQSLIFDTEHVVTVPETDETESDDAVYAEPSGDEIVTFQSVVDDVEKHADVEDAILDPVTEQYVLENINENYSKADKIELANVLMVKNTFADSKYLAKDSTIDDLMHSENLAQAFITMTSGLVAVYNLDDDSDYLVAFANTLHNDRTSTVTDVIFAHDNNNGEVLDNCYYDDATGLVYISKDHYMDEDGGNIVGNVQVQFLQYQETDVDEIATPVTTTTVDDDEVIETTQQDVNPFELETTVKTEKGLQKEEMTVSVNGLIVDDDSYVYDAEQGTVTIQSSSASVQTVSVESQKETFVSKVKDLFEPLTVHAATPDQWVVLGEIELERDAYVGYYETFSSYYAYGGDGWIGSYATSNLQETANLIAWGGGLNWSNISTHEAEGLFPIVMHLKMSDANIKLFEYLDSNISDVTRLQCAHISNPIGSAGLGPVGGQWGWITTALRVLSMGTDSNGREWIICGFLTQTTHTQAGVGFYKFYVKPRNGELSMKKESSLPNITNGNQCYSLAGAKYGIYTDAACTQNVATLTTKEDGSSNVVELKAGTYYWKELSASPGYEVYNPPIENRKVTITAGQPTSFTAQEPPGNDPTGIEITKIWNGPETDTIPTLEGTQFTIKYYDGYYTKDNLPSTPKRTWVLEVKKDKNTGKFITGLADSYLVEGSDEFYRDGSGLVCLPYGTISIQETKPAAGYTLEGYLTDENGKTISTDSEVYVAQINKDTGAVALQGGSKFTGYNTPVFGSIKLKKYDSDGKTPLAGVTFQCVGKTVEDVYTATTDSNGEIVFDNLYPDVYTITETSTVNGHTLLKEPIVVEVPMRVTEEYINEFNVDRDSVTYDPADDIYYIHEFTYEITNDVTFKMPMSGGFATPMTFVPLIAGMGILGGLGVVGFRKKRKK